MSFETRENLGYMNMKLIWSILQNCKKRLTLSILLSIFGNYYISITFDFYVEFQDILRFDSLYWS